MATLASVYEVMLVARADGVMAADVRPLVAGALSGAAALSAVDARSAADASSSVFSA